jgi:hypothetical protein
LYTLFGVLLVVAGLYLSQKYKITHVKTVIVD